MAAELSPRTRLVAVTGASNLLGTRPDLPAIARLVHDRGALFFVDAVHLVPHAAVDQAALGADFLACSPYKFFGPHCGVLTARPELLETLQPDKLLPSSDAVPDRFELGTLPFELMAGTTAAVDFMAGLSTEATGSRRDRVLASMEVVEAYEDALRQRPRVAPGGHRRRRAARPRRRAHAHRPVHGAGPRSRRPSASSWPESGVNAPAGSFYAFEAARWMGLGAAGGDPGGHRAVHRRLGRRPAGAGGRAGSRGR